MIGRFRFPQMPIAGQLMILLVGALVIAQGATLLLTLAFPPQPPPQHSLEDIARAMRGQKVETEGARPLLRTVVDQAPRPEGPGWLSATGPRDRLAGLLNAAPSDVMLMFYVPLPAGAQPLAPVASQARRTLQAQTSPADNEQDRPSTRNAVSATQAPSKTDADAASTPPAVAVAFVPVRDGDPLLIRARYSPSDQPRPFGARPPAGFPAGGFAANGLNTAPRNNAWRGPAPGLAPQRPVATPQSPRPWADPERNFSRPTGRPVASPNFSPPSTGNGPFTARPSAGDAWPRPIGQSPGEEAAPHPGGGGIGKALAMALADRRRAAAASSALRVGAVVSTSMALTSVMPAAKPEPRLAAAPVDQPPRVAASPTPSASHPVERAVAAPDTAPAPEIGAATETPRAPSIEPADLLLTPAVAAPAPARRGLFAPAPAGYIEGDFVAARRIGDRWVVVEPRPEGFPTAWQSRVMLWFLLSFALVAPFGWLFARRITAPLRSFADAAERLGRDPSASTTVQGGSAEIGRAAAAFNQMQARLKRYVDDRTAMIGAISHDLRTPLTRMRFRLEAVPERMKPGFETDIDQMEAMISSVLAFMRDQAEGGSRQRLDLRALLKEAVDNAVAGGANVAIEPGEAVEVDADAVALNRVFANLLDNAVKYGDRAVVRLAREGDDVVAAVHDFGPGLPDSELERVFKPFYRTPGAAASEAPGIGLGLANSRAIVLAHGGTIRLKSNGGLTAEVRLPIAA